MLGATITPKFIFDLRFCALSIKMCVGSIRRYDHISRYSNSNLNLSKPVPSRVRYPWIDVVQDVVIHKKLYRRYQGVDVWK